MKAESPETKVQLAASSALDRAEDVICVDCSVYCVPDIQVVCGRLDQRLLVGEVDLPLGRYHAVRHQLVHTGAPGQLGPVPATLPLQYFLHSAHIFYSGKIHTFEKNPAHLGEVVDIDLVAREKEVLSN